MNLIWTQSRFAWIAALPAYADDCDSPVTRTVKPEVQTLCQKLLSIAGTHVCVLFDEPDLDLLIRYGDVISADGLQIQPGEARRCHTNTVKLWKANRKNHQIATGYGLTERDGMWRQHSWIVHRDGYIIETTEPRVKYFGVVLRGHRLFKFVNSNAD